MQKLKKKFQILEPSRKDAGHLWSTEDTLLLKRLFALCAAQMIALMVNRRSEKRINIRLDRLYLFGFFFEPVPFCIQPFLFFKEPCLLCLQRLHARQFFIALHGKQCTPRRLKDHKLGFVLCLETRLIFRLLEGVIYGLEALVVGDIFDERLDFPQSRFNAFQLLAGAVIGAMNILDLLLKIGVLEQVVFREIVECPCRFLEDRELCFIWISTACFPAQRRAGST